MKRDWDLIREILLRLEEKAEVTETLTAADFGEDRSLETTYQVELLEEAGLAVAILSKSVGEPTHFFAYRLTWAGHEFLDTIRSDNVWTRTKRTFVSKSLTMTFDLVKTVAAGIAVEILKSHIPA